jgi:glycosyltransferase involved in cell wall biosynthesis
MTPDERSRRNGGDKALALRIGVFMATLAGGGLEKTMLALATGLADRGHKVMLLPCRREGRLAATIPPQLEVVALEAASGLQGRLASLRADPGGWRAMALPFLLAPKPPKPVPVLPALARWLKAERPDVLIGCMPQENLVAVQARCLAGVPTRVVLTEHNTLSEIVRRARSVGHTALPPLIERQYPMADAVVAVSAGVADDLARTAGLPRAAIRVIHNPVVPPGIDRLAAAAIDHPWLQPRQPPVVLGIGRLVEQKGFSTLLRAFARLRRERPARLVILGDAADPEATAKRRGQLEALAIELGVAADFALPGYVDNPFAWAARAAVFVLSSTHEGFGNVVAEALASGCPVVSTDCPSGPSEILEGGRWGRMVPVGDDAAMAIAIAATLDHPPDRKALRARGLAFSVDAAVDRYEALLREVVSRPG